jgi:hypothetical protein
LHVAPVTSTGKYKNFVRGHGWVVLSVPWSPHPWSVPILFHLYRGKGNDWPKKTQLARELLGVFVDWLGKDMPVRVLLDSGYVARDVVAGWPKNLTFFGALRTNATLFAPLAKPAGRRRRGDSPPPFPDWTRSAENLRLPAPACTVSGCGYSDSCPCCSRSPARVPRPRSRRRPSPQLLRPSPPPPPPRKHPSRRPPPRPPHPPRSSPGTPRSEGAWSAPWRRSLTERRGRGSSMG